MSGVPKWLKRSGTASDLDLYSNFLIFTFVRNPFDRFLSFFLQGSRAVRVTREDGSLDRDYFNGRKTCPDVHNLRILPPPYASLEECAEQTQQGLWALREDLYIHGKKYTEVQLNYERWHSTPQTLPLLQLNTPANNDYAQSSGDDGGRAGTAGLRGVRASCRHGESGAFGSSRAESPHPRKAPGPGPGFACIREPKNHFDGNPCSFIGRLEHFDQDFSALVSFLGLPHLPMEKRNVSFERNVAGKRKHYSTYYTRSARRLVEEIYATDLDLLGYEFEDETRTSVLVPLYDMDQLRQQRGEVEKRRIKRSIGEMGFRHLIRICLVTKKTIRRFLPRVLIDAIRKNIVLNDRGPMRGGR